MHRRGTLSLLKNCALPLPVLTARDSHRDLQQHVRVGTRAGARLCYRAGRGRPACDFSIARAGAAGRLGRGGRGPAEQVGT